MIVANPIYDIVFKYLMEDERIAKTILSALLKMDVVDVKVRRNEYTNSNRENLSIFRIDFGATIQQTDGSKQLILIELQKTWLETETLGKKAYVRRHSYDYNDNLVTKGLPNPFIDSLTHDSIIVQIPRLHGQVNNRVEKVLSIFDQSQMDGPNKQVLNIDESLYADDADMLHIVHRLLAAASDSKMRHEMNVEDEYYSVIEKRDTTIMMKDRQIAQQNATIQEQGATIQEQGAMLRSTIKLLINAGMTPELIAANLGVPIETVTRHMD